MAKAVISIGNMRADEGRHVDARRRRERRGKAIHATDCAMLERQHLLRHLVHAYPEICDEADLVALC